MSQDYSEDKLVQQTTAAYLHDALGWESVYAYNDETFGPDGLLGRKDETEVVLTRYLLATLRKLNPNRPEEAYRQAVEALTAYDAAKTMLQINEEKYALQRDGVPVTYRTPQGKERAECLKVFDFEHPEKNDFLAVRELWVRGPIYRRRPDIIGFVNGLPLLFVELKKHHKDLRLAYDGNLSDYRDTIPHIFHHNAFIVLANGLRGRLGSLTSKYAHFGEWKRLAEGEPGKVDFQTLLNGFCAKTNFMDLFENFILFDHSKADARKIIARNHQYLGVNQAFAAAQERERARRQAGRLLAHPGRRQVLFDGLPGPQSSPQAARRFHLPAAHRPRGAGPPALQDLCRHWRGQPGRRMPGYQRYHICRNCLARTTVMFSA